MKHNSVMDGGLIGSVIGVEPFEHDYTRAKRSVIKRLIDIALSSVLLVFIAPFLLVISILVKLSDGGDVFFTQYRPGVGGRLFPCYKFRTMAMDAEERLNDLLENDPEAAEDWRLYKKLKKDPRITLIGRFLRKTSIDEIPQLFNILKGEMSIIGPRPITQREIPDYGSSADFAIYGAVRPGVLGLWQVSGRSDTDYERRIQLDAQYARDWSIWMDLKILFLGVPVVLFGKGAY
ncbi:MAG: UDP-phosphate galactose phosphotransferase [Hirschia sp.]|nr:UDP-phosphate galactose phosphotransferase [Hirschia sp.]|tara:strand:- start:177 stop:878 length:702 start_codon:yes stop_codon:yes gene_type:complete